jgi:REP element-mobilizing transposase RayT
VKFIDYGCKQNSIEGDIWYRYRGISEPYYDIQLTIKYRNGLINERTERIILEVTKGFKDRYAIEVSHAGFDKNHVNKLCKFLPKYSSGQVIKLIESITSKEIFEWIQETKKELWGTPLILRDTTGYG